MFYEDYSSVCEITFCP